MPAPPLLPQGTLDFTGLVREDMLARLQALFNQLNPEWDDYSPSYPENLLLEGMVFMGDIIRGTMEERVRQLNWATVSDRLAAIRLSRLSGFRIPGAGSATISGTLATSTGAAVLKSITVPVGTKLFTGTTANPKRHRTTAEAIIDVGQSSVQLNLEQAELINEVFESTNEPNTEVLLDRSPYIEGTAVIEASDGLYTEVSTFLGAASTDKVFFVFVDDQGRARVRFGTGINGAIPQGNISVDYKIGGGVAGEVEAGASWFIEDPLPDSENNIIPLVFTNTVSSNPATDPMTVEEARVRGPQSLQTINRLVTPGDFEFVAETTPGIARALMATSEDAAVIAEDNGRLVLVALGEKLASGRFAPAVPTAAKIAEVSAQMVEDGPFPPVMGFRFDVVAVDLLVVDIVVRIFKTANANATDTATAVRAALADFFAVTLADKSPNASIDFGLRLLGSDGQPDFLLLWAQVFDAIMGSNGSNGVRYLSSSANNLLLNGLHGSVSVDPLKFPALGTVTIFDEDQGGIQI
jgi:hypothetical protein